MPLKCDWCDQETREKYYRNAVSVTMSAKNSEGRLSLEIQVN
jgi:hypothetical protein